VAGQVDGQDGGVRRQQGAQPVEAAAVVLPSVQGDDGLLLLGAPPLAWKRRKSISALAEK